MALLHRRERRPPEAVALLDDGERFVSWADTSAGSVVVATSLGLWWPFPGGARRMPWQHVDKVVWRHGVLTVTEADVIDDALLVDHRPVSVLLEIPRDLPAVVRKRVEANIVKTELLAVGGGAVRFVARRVPGRDGVTWWARIEPGTPDTERLRSAIHARLAILRSEP